MQLKEKKEKTQITIRVDSNLMNAAYRRMEKDNTRLTDIFEWGLALALAERSQMSVWDKEVRFMVANSTKDQQRMIRGLLVAMAEPLMDPPPPKTVAEEKIWELLQWFLADCNELPNVRDCIEYYGHYGKKRE